MRGFIFLITTLLMLAGCAKYSLVEPNRTAIGDSYTVEPQIPWSAASTGKTVIWTVDGPPLQELRFISKIDDSEAPFEGADAEKSPKFKKGMTGPEVKDLVLEMLAMAGAQKIKAKSLRPFKFGGHPGFRFEVNFVTENGLEKTGMVVGSVIKEKLYLITYAGTRVHYFAKHREHVEEIIESIKWE